MTDTQDQPKQHMQDLERFTFSDDLCLKEAYTHREGPLPAPSRLIELSASFYPVHLTQSRINVTRFNTHFLCAFDFENLLQLRKLNEKVGSRSLAWRMMLGSIPALANPERWLGKIQSNKDKYQSLVNKYIKETDQSLMHMIQKDVDRTLQEIPFFQDSEIRQGMNELLYIWASENTDYLYQQGMNDVLSILMVALASDFCSEETSSASKVCKMVHDPANFWSEAYAMFSRLMALGVKGIYYRDVKKIHKSEVRDSIASTTAFSRSSLRFSSTSFGLQSSRFSSVSAKSLSNQRERLIKQMQLQQEEAEATDLKRRANRIFNVSLRRIDSKLHQKFVALNIQPELVLVKWLKCLLSREFSLQSLLEAWDFLLQGITTEGRLDSTIDCDDNLRNLDYLCLALIERSREHFLQGDYMDCLQICMKPSDLQESESIIKSAINIQKLMNPSPKRPPMDLAKEVKTYELLKVIKQKDIEQKTMTQNVQAQKSHSYQFEFEKREEQLTSRTQDDKIVDAIDIKCKTFKLKSCSHGKVVYDQRTNQRIYLSPFDRFLEEQEQLFNCQKDKSSLDYKSEYNQSDLTTTIGKSYAPYSSTPKFDNLKSFDMFNTPMPDQMEQYESKSDRQYDSVQEQQERGIMQARKTQKREMRQVQAYLKGQKGKTQRTINEGKPKRGWISWFFS